MGKVKVLLGALALAGMASAQESILPRAKLLRRLRDMENRYLRIKGEYEYLQQNCLIPDSPYSAVSGKDTLDKCKAYPVDLILIVDSSESISETDFKIQRKFLKDIVTILGFDPSGSSGTIMSLVQFSTWPQIEIKRSNERIKILNAIAKMRHMQGYTKLGWAIDHTNKHLMVFDDTLRRHAVPVVVVLTDGQSQDGVGNIEAMHRKGALVVAVGVGEDVDLDQLAQIASAPEHVHPQMSYKALADYKLNLNKDICTTVVTNECKKSCKKTCVKKPGPTTGTCSKPIDLIFVVDGSASLTELNKHAFDHVKEFLIASLEGLDFKGDKTGTVCSMLQFSSHTRPEFRMIDDKTELVDKINGVKHMRAGTNLFKAIDYVNKHWIQTYKTDRWGRRGNLGVLRAKPHHKVDADAVLVILTDAQDGDDGQDERENAYKTIQDMHDKDITTMAFGFGNVNIEHLRKLASVRPYQTTFMKPTAKDLGSLSNILSQSTCKQSVINECTDVCSTDCTEKEVVKVESLFP